MGKVAATIGFVLFFSTAALTRGGEADFGCYGSNNHMLENFQLLRHELYGLKFSLAYEEDSEIYVVKWLGQVPSGKVEYLLRFRTINCPEEKGRLRYFIVEYYPTFKFRNPPDNK